MKGIEASTQDRNQEAGTKAEIREECYLLACSSCPAEPDFLYSPDPPAWEWYHPQWADLPKSIINEQNASQTCPQASLMEAIPQVTSFLPDGFGLC